MLWGDGNGHGYHHGWQMMDGNGGVNSLFTAISATPRARRAT